VIEIIKVQITDVKNDSIVKMIKKYNKNYFVFALLLLLLGKTVMSHRRLVGKVRIRIRFRSYPE
jgi:hypothetical protein